MYRRRPSLNFTENGCYLYMNQNFSDSSINSNCSRWNSAILRKYIVLFPSSRSLAIVLSYYEEVNLKVSLLINIFLDSPFPLVEITISLSCHSVICLHSRNLEQQTLQAHYKLTLYFVFSIHSGGDRWLELAVFLPKKMQQVIRTFLLVKPIFFTNRLIARRSWFVFQLHTLSTPEFRPRTLRDTDRFILVANNMSCAIFRSEKLELLLHTSV